MPIYEFYCPDCHRILNFFSRRIDTEKRPACPRCGRSELTRRVSSFAISKGRKESPPAGPGEEAMPGMDDSRLEAAMESLAREAEGINEDDPRQAAHLMRKLWSATGLPVNEGMEEALKRMEAGEDPEKIEQEMGDVFDEDPFAAGGKDAAEPKKGLAGLRRRALPPTTDPTLYEM